MKTKIRPQKLLSAVLALVMLLSTMAVLSVATSAALTDSAAWDGNAQGTQPAGEGTESSPWKIESAANLAWVSFNALGKVDR